MVPQENPLRETFVNNFIDNDTVTRKGFYISKKLMEMMSMMLNVSQKNFKWTLIIFPVKQLWQWKNSVNNY